MALSIVLKFFLAIFATTSCNSLRDAHQLHSRSIMMLDSVLMKWSKATPSISDSAIAKLPGSHRDVYGIFQAVWRPDSILLLGKFEFPHISSYYENAKYVMIQNYIKYYIVDDSIIENASNEGLMIDEKAQKHRQAITNFRPPNKIFKGNTLYLTDEVVDGFSSLLGDNLDPTPMTSKYNQDSSVIDESQAARFLRELLVVVRGHNGGWILPTFPWVTSLYISKSGIMALAYYRVGYQGGMAKLIKRNDSWIIANSLVTWIE